MRVHIAAILLALSAFASAQEFPSTVEVPAEERILHFHSDIVVHADASMTVTETIEVAALGQQIQRGIYRDFPTTYWKRVEPLPFAIPYRVGFEIIDVKRDGQPEPYHTESQGNGVRTYFGDEDVFLQPGIYTYTFVYKTWNQLGFFSDYDELYWNVTGNGWIFPIDVAEAVVHLPNEIPGDRIDLFGYTGDDGDEDTNFESEVLGPSEARFISTVPLAPSQGLTIGVQFPKGHVQQPHWSRFFVEGKSNAIAVAGMLFVAIYYVIAWTLVGIDPSRGRVFPTDTPPAGYSPAALRYIERMGFDKDTFMVAIVNMATKGYVRIEQDEGRLGTYHIIRDQTGDDVLTTEERELADTLFASRSSVELKQSNHRILREAIGALKASLDNQFHGRLFKTNTRWRILGFLISMAFIVAAILFEDGEARAIGLFMGVWLSGWTAGCSVLILQVFRAWRNTIRTRSITTALGSLFVTAFSLPFIAGELFGLTAFAANVSFGVTVALLVMIVLNVIFFYLLKAPTREGRAVLDEWEGFAQQLRGRSNLLSRQGADNQQALFEQYLPYALALGLGAAWADAFAAAAGAAAMAPTSYRHPAWYHGPMRNDWSADRFVSGLSGGFSGAISASSTAPGSSSGSSGGSSGGGGGGGGGGGW